MNKKKEGKNCWLYGAGPIFCGLVSTQWVMCQYHSEHIYFPKHFLVLLVSWVDLGAIFVKNPLPQGRLIER